MREKALVLLLSIAAFGCESAPDSEFDSVAEYSSSATGPGSRFLPIDVNLVVEDQLAAYQIELTIRGGEAQIVGVEGGEVQGFRDAPYYDPAALTQGRIVLAAFSTKHVLNQGHHRLARIHMRETGPEPVEYELRVITAASASGARIMARPDLAPGKGATP